MIALDCQLPGVAAWLAQGDRDGARLALLDDDERRRAARLPGAAAARYVAARCTLRRIVARRLGTHDAFRLGHVGGRPILPDHPHIHISVSYSGDWIAVALADRRVGVDVEHIVTGAVDPPSLDTAEFYARWTLAEASFKARGDRSAFDPDVELIDPLHTRDRGTVRLSLPSPVPGLALAIAAAA